MKFSVQSLRNKRFFYKKYSIWKMKGTLLSLIWNINGFFKILIKFSDTKEINQSLWYHEIQKNTHWFLNKYSCFLNLFLILSSFLLIK